MNSDQTNLDTHQSVYREHLLEHLLIGELLKHAWLTDEAALEVARPEVDRSGYDLILQARGVTRHVQLKTSAAGARAASQKMNAQLSTKAGGCVICTTFDPTTLALGPFRFFGGVAGEPMPDIDDLPTARHTKANAQGIKNLRPNIRVVAKGRFTTINSIPELYDLLFARK